MGSFNFEENTFLDYRIAGHIGSLMSYKRSLPNLSTMIKGCLQLMISILT